MSLPAQPQQQPPLVYPNTVTGPPSSHSHSNGSFGTVFIVLAVILVVSAVACCLGRLCNRRQNRPKPPSNHHQKNPSIRPVERERKIGRDVEFGFEKGFPTGRPTSNGDPKGHKPSEFNGHKNGYFKGVAVHADDRVGPKAGP